MRQSDHVRRTCAGVLRAARRMEKLNEAWSADGPEREVAEVGRIENNLGMEAPSLDADQ